MKSENKIIKKKRCKPALTFQTRDPSHYIGSITHKKNCETQSLANQILKDKIKKKNYKTKESLKKQSN